LLRVQQSALLAPSKARYNASICVVAGLLLLETS
jgi:hypothetical protein